MAPPRKVRRKTSLHADGTGPHPIHAGASLTLDPIITMNAGGIIQSASESVEAVFGWTPEELFGRNVKVLIPEPRRSSLDRYLDRYRDADTTKTLHRTRRFNAIHKNGSALQIELSMSRADVASQVSAYFIGIVRDVTRQIDISGDSPAIRTRLQQLITEQTRALATANLRLQLADRLASLGTLAAGLGHDMNNVLLPVRARLNAIEHGGVTPAALTHVRAVRRSVAYLQHLSDALHFLAIDPDGPGIASDGEGVTDLVHWWTQVGPLLLKAVPRHVAVVVRLPKRLPAVHISPHWLTQAMLNLIVNAGEAMPKERRNARVVVAGRMSDDGKAVHLSVSDNGRGMTQATQHRALDLFFTTKSRGMGTGLGLPMVRKVAVRAGGDIEITSSLGKGTTVIMKLPLAPGNRVIKVSQKSTGISAAISVADHRTAALICQILIAAKANVNVVRPDRPGKVDLWVTEPLAASLDAAKRWCRGGTRTLVLVGAPSKVRLKAWEGLGAMVIDPPDDFEAMREIIGQAITADWKNKGGKT
ncbi:MAG: PAS domain-containing sensor histidine kinase [Planctomycetota bacterium]|nr:PAS domain-containing sensor histidine kinase [Planctomycetota bacterium]